MSEAKKHLISSGFSFFRRTGLHRLAAPLTRGAGAILMFHQVRPWVERDFAPNRLLEITPDFLDAVLTRLTALGFAIVSLDAALNGMGEESQRPFAVLTFDDGYRDTRDFALPILAKHGAPFTMYVTTGFAERTARLWWVELEEAIRRLAQITVEIGGAKLALPSATTAEKAAAFAAIYGRSTEMSEEALLAVTGRLAARAGIEPAALAEKLCLDWAGIEEIAGNDLCTIGVHTLTHPRLAKLGEAAMRRELGESRRLIEARIGRQAVHLAYPIGNRGVAGAREYKAAADLGFASAVTTRPGMIFPEHAGHRTALPRVSINGNWQSLDFVEILLSGVPFALWNRGKRVA
ncbi:MAG: polysaccharide deacetylase family protein [Methylovirgula sp.]